MALRLPVTWLFVPGDRPDRFQKAAASGAEAVILDLEDAVGSADKELAREAVSTYLATGAQAWVRINGTETDEFDEDLKALAGCQGLSGLVLPKAEAPGQVALVATRVPALRMLALVETARGLLGAHELASHESVVGLALGSIDLAAELGVDPENDDALLLARLGLVLASRAARHLGGPVDAVSTVIDDQEALIASARRGRSLGFGGKLCIHPAQVELVSSAYAPTEAELAWAAQVTQAARERDHEVAPGAFRVGAEMVDGPVLERARQTLERGRRSLQGGRAE